MTFSVSLSFENFVTTYPQIADAITFILWETVRTSKSNSIFLVRPLTLLV